MNVEVAKTAGFCFGVERAVNTVYEQVEKGNGPIYTYGPIIHNEEVVKDLEQKGVTVVEGEENLSKITEGTVIIRSHGVSKHIYDILNQNSINYVDATCPFVKKIHRIVEDESKKGSYIIITGNETHPEVEGIKGWCVHDNISIVKNVDEANALIIENNQKICIVSQTTFNYNKFKEIVDKINEKGYDIIVLNTICSATEERQREAADVAKRSDAMIVIGGKSSSNTQKLFEICKMECENTYYIQTIKDLDVNLLKSAKNVGITAGASTPNNIIEEVQKDVRRDEF